MKTPEYLKKCLPNNFIDHIFGNFRLKNLTVVWIFFSYVLNHVKSDVFISQLGYLPFSAVYQNGLSSNYVLVHHSYPTKLLTLNVIYDDDPEPCYSQKWFRKRAF